MVGFKLIGVIVLFAISAGGVFAWQYFGTPEGVMEDETADWQTYRDEEEIQIGKFEIDYEKIAELQKSMDEGHQPWRLDPKMALQSAGLTGFFPEDFNTLKQIFISASAGVAKYEITHKREIYIITMIQPVPGEAKIWTVLEIEKK